MAVTDDPEKGCAETTAVVTGLMAATVPEPTVVAVLELVVLAAVPAAAVATEVPTVARC